MTIASICSTDDCSAASFSRGLCKRCYNKQWRAEHPGYFKKHRAVNREARREQTRQWRADNEERWKAWQSAYYAANKERYSEHCSNRNAALRGAFVERVTKARLRELDGDACCYCGTTLSFEVRPRGVWVPNAAELEHVIPLSGGGKHAYSNAALSCATCNRSKGRSLDWSVRDGHRLAPKVNTGG